MRKLLFCLLIGCGYLFIGLPHASQALVVERSEYKLVEVKGAVMKPDVYELAWDASIRDAIQAAGGVCDNADLSRVNQTQKPQSGDVVIIPLKSTQTCISINTATAAELDSLSGIGPKIAQRIIEERALAPFVQLEDIKRVKGIGDKLFERIKDDICL